MEYNKEKNVATFFYKVRKGSVEVWCSMEAEVKVDNKKISQLLMVLYFCVYFAR